MNNSVIWAQCSQHTRASDRQHQENGSREAGAPQSETNNASRLSLPGEHLMTVTMETETNHSTPLVTYVVRVCCA